MSEIQLERKQSKEGSEEIPPFLNEAQNSIEGKYEWLRGMMNTERSSHVSLTGAVDETEERWSAGEDI